MLKTVYKLTRPGMIKVNEYYEWQLQWPQDAKPGHKISCPGCGKMLAYVASQGAHQCPGTLTPHPVQPSKNKRVYRKGEREAKLAEYITTSTHTVQISD